MHTVTSCTNIGTFTTPTAADFNREKGQKAWHCLKQRVSANEQQQQQQQQQQL